MEKMNKAIEKIVINLGIGKTLGNSKLREIIVADLTKITGQKPVFKLARKAIAGFKIKKGDPVGLSLTLRGKRMYDFLEKLRIAVLPRIRDFKGLKKQSFDREGNFTLGIAEHTSFPEIKPGEIQSPFGLELTIKTKAKNKEEGRQILETLGFPFEE